MIISGVVIETVLYLALFFIALLFGGGFVEGYTLLELSSAVLVAVVVLFGVFRVGSKSRVAFFILLAWITFLCFQLISLPLPFVRMISPNLIRLIETFSPTGLAASHWIPVSMNTYGMKVEIGKLLAYLGFFSVSFGFIGSKVQLKRLALMIIGIGFALSLLGLIFHRINPGRIYALFVFTKASPFTPFLNKNHFANYLVMTLPLVLAFMALICDQSSLTRLKSLKLKILWFASKEATPLLILSGIFLVQFTALLASASRGGLFGFTVAVLVFGLFFVLKTKTWSVGLMFVVIAGVALWMGLDLVKPLIEKMRTLQQIPGTDYALRFRLSNWKAAFRIFLDFPLVGIGAGNFHELFPFYKSLPEPDIFSQVKFYYAENELLQALSEVGLIGSGILIAFWVMSLIRFFKWWPSIRSRTIQWLSLGLASSCLGMTAHSFLDFATHIPANMALFAVLGGVLTRLTSDEPMIEHPETLRTSNETSPPPLSSPPERGRGQGKGVENKVLFGALNPKMLIKIVLIGAGFMILIPILWRQWTLEHYYLEAQKKLSKVEEDKLISAPPLLSAYENLLKARKISGQARINHALGRVFIYFGLQEQKKQPKRNIWFEQAEDSIKKSISQSPWKAEYHYTLAQLYQASGRHQLAESPLRNAVTLEPKNPFYLFQLARNQLRLNKPETASILFRETLLMNTAYLEPILEALANEKIPLEVDYLYGLIPPDQRSLLANQIVRFFESKGDLQTSEKISHEFIR